MILSNVGTAVDLYPIARRQNELLAIGYVAARIIECVFLAGGIIFVLGVVSCRTLRTRPTSVSSRSRIGRFSSGPA